MAAAANRRFRRRLPCPRIFRDRRNPLDSISVADSLKNLSNNDTSMKFGGFKGQMMLYLKKHLDIKKIQYGAKIQDGG